MKKKPYETPGFLYVEIGKDDLLTISSGEKLNLDDGEGSGHGVFKWLNV